MKKIMAIFLVCILILSVLTGCGDNPKPLEMTGKPSAIEVRLGGLKGPTSIGLVKLLDDAEKNKTENNYQFQMAAATDELTPSFLQGNLDILAVPANLGSILYHNSNGQVQTIAICALGVSYIVEKGEESVSSILDLKGQTIYATGKGSTPEYALNFLLTQNGLNPHSDVKVVWKNEPSEVVAQLTATDHAIAMLPQPFVTVAAGQVEGLRVAIDMTAAWEALDLPSSFITATLIVRKAFADEHPETVRKFIEDYRKSVDYVNKKPAEASVLVEKYGIVKAAVAEKAIPKCNVVCITGTEMKTELSAYLQVLADQSSKSVGGTVPSDDFYVIYEE